MKNTCFVLMVLLLTTFSFAQGIVRSEVLPERDHEISVNQLADYTERYAAKFEIDVEHPNKFRMDANQVLNLLLQGDVAEFVMELGVNDLGRITPIYRAADKDGKMLPMILEKTTPCPPFCPSEKAIPVRTGSIPKAEDYK